MFSVSEMTARRDLNELDRQGMLRRIHGGAVASLGRSYEPPFQTRSSKNQAAKKAIGLKAAELIYDGDSNCWGVERETQSDDRDELLANCKSRRRSSIIGNRCAPNPDGRHCPPS